jgi:hypothetical protein
VAGWGFMRIAVALLIQIGPGVLEDVRVFVECGNANFKCRTRVITAVGVECREQEDGDLCSLRITILNRSCPCLCTIHSERDVPYG